MKTPSPRLLVCLAPLLLAAAFFAVPSLLVAQQPGVFPGGPPGLPVPSPMGIHPGLPTMPGPQKLAKKFDLEFPGGSPAKLVAAISKSLEQPLNVIIMPKDQLVEIPPLSLKSVSVADLFTSLSQASQQHVPHRQGKNIEFSPSSISFLSTNGNDEDALWYLSHADSGAVDALQKEVMETRSVKIFSLKGLVRPNMAHLYEKITTQAIKSTWELAGEPASDKGALQFQLESGLLLIKGTETQIKLVEEVLQKISLMGESLPTVDEAGGK